MSGAHRDPGPAAAGTPSRTAQAAVEQARARVLGGRGPGADRFEIDQHTRSRVWLAGRPTVERRAALAGQTARVRGDSAAIARHVAATADELGVTAAALHRRLTAVRALRAALPARAVAATVGTGIGFAAALVLRARHGHSAR